MTKPKDKPKDKPKGKPKDKPKGKPKNKQLNKQLDKPKNKPKGKQMDKTKGKQIDKPKKVSIKEPKKSEKVKHNKHVIHISYMFQSSLLNYHLLEITKKFQDKIDYTARKNNFVINMVHCTFGPFRSRVTAQKCCKQLRKRILNYHQELRMIRSMFLRDQMDILNAYFDDIIEQNKNNIEIINEAEQYKARGQLPWKPDIFIESEQEYTKTS